MFSRLHSKLIVIFLLALVLLAPGRLLAAGETYGWKDSSTQIIDARGGDYKGSAQFTPSGQTGEFSAAATIMCGGKETNVLVELKLPGTSQPGQSTTGVTSVTGCSTPGLDHMVSVAATTTTSSNGEKICDQGALSWIFCPLIDHLEKAITSVVGNMIEPVLRINSLTPSTTPSLYTAWTHMRNLANVLLVLIFLVIIGSNVLSIGLDSYSVKRALPRLIIAAIVIQFSFAATSLAVDVSNIFGAGIGDVIQGTTQAASAGGTGSVIGNIGIAIVGTVGVAVALFTSFALIFPLLVSFVIGVFAFFLTLGARLLLIAVLIVISPLAIIASVLPNTQTYYKQWWKLFLRLLLMYPIIMGLLGIAGRANEILSFTTSTGNNGVSTTAINILKPFIFLYLFLLIPQTFKWAGSWMATASAAINRRRDSLVKYNQGAQYYKDAQQRRRDRQLELSRRVAESQKLADWQSKGTFGRGKAKAAMIGTGFVLGGAPHTGLAHNRAYSKQLSDYKKELDDLTVANNPGNVHTAIKAAYGDSGALSSLHRNAPSLVRYTKSQAGRMALFAKLADTGAIENGDFEAVRNAPDNRSREFGLAMSASGKHRSKHPFGIARMAKDDNQYEVKNASGRVMTDAELQPFGMQSKRQAGDIDINAVMGMVRRWSAPALADNDKVASDNFAVAASDVNAAWVMAEAAQISEFDKAFNPNGRYFMDLNKRLSLLNMLSNHKPVFATGRGERLKDAMLRHLQQDEDLLIDGLVVAEKALNNVDITREQATQRVYASPAAVEAVIKRWIG